MNVLSLVKLLGGLGLFLFGMTLMGDSLEKTAGEKLEQTLAKMTKNPIKGVAFGAAVTAIIQSSAATTVMVVGFVNAGIMSLMQATGVIMGANIGTTITAQILRLDSSGTGGAYFALLKPANLAYIAVAIGMVLAFAKTKKRDIGKIFIGFGILFIGMNTMETALSGLTESAAFRNMFSAFKNPIIGLLIGILVTAAIQSSSASIGILQALSGTGIVTWGSAIPIILGQNIGSCVTALIASVGAKKNAKRAAFIHIWFNILGTIVFMAVFYTLKNFINFSFIDTAINKASIANFHTVFNVAATVLFLPFSRFFVFLAEKTVRTGEEKSENIIVLDTRFYKTPAVALERCHHEISEMGKRALLNFKAAEKYTLYGDNQARENFDENENFLDLAEVKIGQYMLGIEQEELSANARKVYNEMIWSVCEFERIGDYAENILNQGAQMRSRKSVFDENINAYLKALCSATEEILEKTASAYKNSDITEAKKIEPMKQAIDVIKDLSENEFINSLSSEQYKFNVGILFTDLCHNCQKIAEHCSVLAINMVEAYEKHEEFDRHKYLKEIQTTPTKEYSECYNNFIGKYMKASANQ